MKAYSGFKINMPPEPEIKYPHVAEKRDGFKIKILVKNGVTELYRLDDKISTHNTPWEAIVMMNEHIRI